jgi:hypothetical protein
VARVLKLLDKEESPEAGMPIRAQSDPTPQVHAAVEESMEVIEASPVNKRKLTKVTEPEVPTVKLAALVVKAVDVADFLASQRKKVILPPVSCVAEVEAFIANKPIPAVPVAMEKLVKKELLQSPEGPVPSLLNHHLSSNIQHILEDIDMESKDLVGMADDNMGPSNIAVVRTSGKALSLIPEAGTLSRAPTPKRPQSLTLARVKKVEASRRFKASDVSGSLGFKSTVEIQPE